jgi:hypothetical protein
MEKSEERFSTCPYCKQLIPSRLFAEHHATCPARKEALRLKKTFLEYPKEEEKEEKRAPKAKRTPAEKLKHYLKTAAESLENIFEEATALLTDEEALKLAEALRKINEVQKSIEDRSKAKQQE